MIAGLSLRPGSRKRGSTKKVRVKKMSMLEMMNPTRLKMGRETSTSKHRLNGCM
jgi:hypothetical protein